MRIGSRFYSRIMLPSLAAVLVFLVAIYLMVIPNYRDNLMDRKRETIRELTNTAWSVLHKLDLMVGDTMDLAMAQQEAAMIIGDMRYGPEMKDYFWITDTVPAMVMHPYRPFMNGMNLSDYRDSRGKNFFVDIVHIVEAEGDGYVDYKWQWKDDSLTVVSKLSYVKAFEPWGWIVGTGIYIDDVNKEISLLTRKVALISLLITLMISAIIAYLARKNYVTERQRQKVQERLQESMQRYKKLVDASTDGVAMVLDREIVYCNTYLLDLLGFSWQDFERKDADLTALLLGISENRLEVSDTASSGKDAVPNPEKRIRSRHGAYIDVIVHHSGFELDGKQGHIYTVRDVSQHKGVERALDLSIEKLRSIADIMHLGVFRCSIDRKSRFIEINAIALKVLGYESESEVRNILLQDLFVRPDEKKQVIRAIIEGLVVKNRLLRIKRSTGEILPVMVSLFPICDTDGLPVFCDGIISDAHDYLLRTRGTETHAVSPQLFSGMLLHPVREFAFQPLACSMHDSVAVAARMMVSAKTSLMAVKSDDGNIIGVLSLSDVSRRMIANELPLSSPVSAIMTSPVVYVSSDCMLVDAFSIMMQHQISHVLIKPAGGQTAISCLSLRSLSDMQKDTPDMYISTLEKAASLPELELATRQLPKIVQLLTETGTNIAAVGDLISKTTDIVTHKIIDKAVAELGVPPSPFVFLALGSEGRREQTLATDQDNAIIFKSGDDEQTAICQSYFLELGKKVCQALNRVGYPLCQGGVMAMNQAWCRDIDGWKQLIREWVSKPDPEQVLQTSIFFDFRPVYGDIHLAGSLQQYISKVLSDRDIYYYNLVRSITLLKLPSIDKLHEGQAIIDLKFPFLVVTAITRLWCLRSGISERNTAERLLILESAGVLQEKLRDKLDQAFRFLMMLRLRNQLKQIELGELPNNLMKAEMLSELDIVVLKKIMTTLADHQKRLAIEFKIL